MKRIAMSFLLALGCDGSSDDADATAVVELERGATFAQLIAAPLAPDAEMLEAMGDTATEATVRERVESGVSGSSIVDDPSCVTFDWAARTATITFTGCTSESTGFSIDGVVTLTATTRPVTFAIAFDALMIDETSVDGDITLAVGGSEGARTFVIDATLAWTDGTTSSSVVLTDVAVIAGASATTLDGSYTLTTDMNEGTGTIDGVTWATGDCHPSSGTITFDPAGAGPTTTFTFLATTPTQGIVGVQIPPRESVEMMLLDPC